MHCDSCTALFRTKCVEVLGCIRAFLSRALYVHFLLDVYIFILHGLSVITAGYPLSKRMGLPDLHLLKIDFHPLLIQVLGKPKVAGLFVLSLRSAVSSNNFETLLEELNT